ncbi:hypothetical protein C8J57DRAFT_1477218 [Mycena rebaudengoi]|nr:hypothetical protein C8J57DRAFT_1477218 [Mycena rebaudengoi]
MKLRRFDVVAGMYTRAGTRRCRSPTREVARERGLGPPPRAGNLANARRNDVPSRSADVLLVNVASRRGAARWLDPRSRKRARACTLAGISNPARARWDDVPSRRMSEYGCVVGGTGEKSARSGWVEIGHRSRGSRGTGVAKTQKWDAEPAYRDREAAKAAFWVTGMCARRGCAIDAQAKRRGTREPGAEGKNVGARMAHLGADAVRAAEDAARLEEDAVRLSGDGAKEAWREIGTRDAGHDRGSGWRAPEGVGHNRSVVRDGERCCEESVRRREGGMSGHHHHPCSIHANFGVGFRAGEKVAWVYGQHQSPLVGNAASEPSRTWTARRHGAARPRLGFGVDSHRWVLKETHRECGTSSQSQDSVAHERSKRGREMGDLMGSEAQEVGIRIMKGSGLKGEHQAHLAPT